MSLSKWLPCDFEQCHPFLWGGGILVDHWSTISSCACRYAVTPCKYECHSKDLTFVKAEISPKEKLSHLPLVPLICVSESGQHWFRYWVVVRMAPSHYLNQCCLIVNWTLRNKIQWNFNGNTKLFIDENTFENIVCEMAAILSRGRWVNKQGFSYSHPSRCQRCLSRLVPRSAETPLVKGTVIFMWKIFVGWRHCLNVSRFQ